MFQRRTLPVRWALPPNGLSPRSYEHGNAFMDLSSRSSAACHNVSGGLFVRVFSVFLAFCIAASAQVAPMLNLVVIEGEGAVNNIRQRTAREPVVQVQDE